MSIVGPEEDAVEEPAVAAAAMEAADVKEMLIVVTEDLDNAERCSKKEFSVASTTYCKDLVTKVAEEYEVPSSSFKLVYEVPAGGGLIDMSGAAGMIEDVCDYQPQRKKYSFILGPADWKPMARKVVSGLAVGDGPSLQLLNNSERTNSGQPSPSDSSTILTNRLDNFRVVGLNEEKDPPPYTPIPYSYQEDSLQSTTGYVGLVNQAMTCYLNSLLQTLFMTPEFRNAIYKANYGEESSTKPGQHNIPYYLQRLFVQLQTSPKRAVETTDVTRSFGWDSSDAWQQHDVQELCRVMFDALEKRWSPTDQADLINQLYQGKMKDYVKCLECGYESARVDSFLDVPLVIKPFGSSKAYSSVQEALNAFVEPETLEGNNQYSCAKCEKMCDAHKGLKFVKFPYLLTLQLKRFDFDYNTLQRIKLNDKMTFPDYLDLNGMVDEEQATEPADDADVVGEAGDTETKTERTPSAIETLRDTTPSVGPGGCPRLPLCTPDVEAVLPDAPTEIEGIAGEGSAASAVSGAVASTLLGEDQRFSTAFSNDLASNNEKNLLHAQGPHMYELFSVMIHSGSALGGHYFAYIKPLADRDGSSRPQQWYNFNDQTVTPITHREMEKTFGGGATRGYYSPSTSAYMLMYRQVDKERNTNFMKTDEFPAHVSSLLETMRQEEEDARLAKEREKETCRIKVYYAPGFKGRGKLREDDLHVHMNTTLKQTVGLVHKLFCLRGVVPVERCRLVKYDDYYHSIEQSYEASDDLHMYEILDGVRSSYTYQLLLEAREEGDEFEIYLPNSITVQCHFVRDGVVRNPVNVRTFAHHTVQEFVAAAAKVFRIPFNRLRAAVSTFGGTEFMVMDGPAIALSQYSVTRGSKLFVEEFAEEQPLEDIHTPPTDVTTVPMLSSDGNELPRAVSADDTSSTQASSPVSMAQAIDRHLNEISLYVVLPSELDVFYYSERCKRQDALEKRVRREEKEEEEAARARLVRGSAGPANSEAMAEAGDGLESDMVIGGIHGAGPVSGGLDEIGGLDEAGGRGGVESGGDVKGVANDVIGEMSKLATGGNDRERRIPSRDSKGDTTDSDELPPLIDTDGHVVDVDEQGPRRRENAALRVGFTQDWMSGTNCEAEEGDLTGLTTDDYPLPKSPPKSVKFADDAAASTGGPKADFEDSPTGQRPSSLTERLNPEGADNNDMGPAVNRIGPDICHTPGDKSWDNGDEAWAKATVKMPATPEDDSPPLEKPLLKSNFVNDVAPFNEELGISFDTDVPPHEVSAMTDTRTVRAMLDRRHTVLDFKKALCSSPLITLSSPTPSSPRSPLPLHHTHFKLSRQFGSGQDIEFSRLNESFLSVPNGNRITVKLGRTLRRDEVRLKVHLLDISNIEVNPSCLFEVIVAKQNRVRQAQVFIAEELRLYHNRDVQYSQCRIRRKLWKAPSTIFRPEQCFSELGAYDNFEVFLEIFRKNDSRTEKPKGSGSIFLRQWFPSQYKLGPIEEIFIHNKSIASLQERISGMRRIPVENIDIGKLNCAYPWNVSLLNIDVEVDWRPNTDTLDGWPIYYTDEGTLLLYRDGREELGELSADRRKELEQQEAARAAKNNRNTYAPRKEKALKIYTDSPTDNPPATTNGKTKDSEEPSDNHSNTLPLSSSVSSSLAGDNGKTSDNPPPYSASEGGLY